VGRTGTPAHLPDGWSLYAETREAVPTANSRRVESWQRRYGTDPRRGMILIEVVYGDVSVPADDPAAFEGTSRTDVRAGDTVVVAQSPSSSRYLWSAAPRVVVDVVFQDTDLDEQDRLAVVRGIAAE
jgi:hypothetical protein